jgi:hypothetical protein
MPQGAEEEDGLIEHGNLKVNDNSCKNKAKT